MKILILDPRSEEWQKICAPIQRETMAKKGGIVLEFFIEKKEVDKEKKKWFAWDALGYLHHQVEERKRKTKNAFGVVAVEMMYCVSAENNSATYSLTYQIHGNCTPADLYAVAGEIITLCGKVHSKQFVEALIREEQGVRT